MSKQTRWGRSLAGGLLLSAGLGVSVVAQTVTGSGSGFVVNEAGWVLTNAHVVEGCAAVRLGGGAEVTTILSDPEADLAALLPATPAARVPLAFRDRPARLAEAILVLGYPLGPILSRSVKATTGTVSALAGVMDDSRFLQVSAPVQPGNSGGPVVDAAGHVIGVVTAILSPEAHPAAQNVNFALTAAEAQRFLRSRGVAFVLADEAAGPAAARDPSDVAEAAAPSVLQVECLGIGQPPPGTGPVRAPAGARMTVMPGRDVLGHDFLQRRGVTLEACEAACLAEARCRAFTWNRRHRVCFLKDDAILLSRHADAVGGVAAGLAGRVIDTGFSVTSDADAPGGDYARLRDSAFLDCFAKCALDDRCRAFAWVRARRDCWLKDRIGPVRPARGVELGVR